MTDTITGGRKYVLFLFVCALAFMVVALYNGFPLVESDSGTYILHGFELQLTKDRTPFYGLFLGLSSLHLSLWLTIFAQSFLLAWLVITYIKLLNQRPVAIGFALLCVVVIIAFTCVAWVTAYLMPDIFAGILLLAILLYLQGNTESRQLLYLAIIFVAISIHNSHFLITAIFSLVVVLAARYRNNQALMNRGLALLGVSVGFWLLMCSINAIRHKGFTFSDGSPVFMVTKFAETGILDTYLKDNCGKKDLKLCAYQGRIPAQSWDFLWSPESPLYKTGGWDSNKVEYNGIIHDVFTTPRYTAMFAKASAVSTLQELVAVHAPDTPMALGSGSEPWLKMQRYFPGQLDAYAHSRQSTGRLSGVVCNYIYYLFFLLSAVWVLLHYSKVMDADTIFIYKCIVLFLLVNAFVTATFSTVHYRFQYRVFWVLPATNAIIILKHYWLKRNPAAAGNTQL